ncbi:MAG: protein tonB [Thermomonas sp.]
MKIRGFALVAALLLEPGPPAMAAEGSKLIEKAEMSMLVSGSIDMRPDGSVERYSIDHSEKLSAAITQMIGTQVSQWRFEPVLVDGKPVAARTNMSLRIVAKPVDERNFNVRIQSASFSGGKDGADERISVLKRTSLGPMVHALQSTGLGAANLYLALKIGTDGKVLDAVVQQVSLPGLGTNEKELARLRNVLGEATVKVVRQWTFAVPQREPEGDPYWSGILPVAFSMGESFDNGYGEWRAYIPGPCAPIPWRTSDRDGRCASDAAPDGVLTLDNAGPKLLTPLMQGG